MVAVREVMAVAPCRYEFEWEREWRIPHALEFKSEDVAILFIPEEIHDQARGFLATAEEEQLRPNYTCLILDGEWNADRINAAVDAYSLDFDF